MATLTSQLILSLVDRVTGPARGIAGSISRLQSSLEHNSRQLDAMRGRMIEAGVVGYGLARAISAPIRSATAFGAMMEDIGQKANIAQESLGGISKTVREIGLATGQGATQAGKAVDFLLGMGASEAQATAAAVPIGKAATAYRAATDDLAGATFAVIDNLKVPADQAAYALDIMAAAGKEGGFELKDMAAEFPAITAAAQTLGIKGAVGVADLTAALEVARKGAGSGSEAATNLQNFLSKVTSQDAIKNFKKFGVDVPKELKKAAKNGTSPIEHMLGVIDSITKGGRPELMGKLFADMQVQQFIRPMLANMEEYRRIRATALAAAGTVQIDFDRRMKTSGGAILRFNAQMENLSIVIGSTLLPALSAVIDKIAPIIEAVARWAEANPDLTAGIVGLAASLVALRVAAIAAQFAFFWARGAYLAAAISGLKVLSGSFGGLSKAMRRFGRERKAAFAGFSMADQVAATAHARNSAEKALRSGMGGAQESARSQAMVAGMSAAATRLVPAASGIVGALTGIFTAFAAGIAGITAPVWVGIGAIVAAVAGVALAVYYYWDRISAWVSGFAGVIGGAISDLVGVITGFGGRIAAAVGSWATDRVVDVGAMLGIDESSIGIVLDGAVEIVRNFATSVVNLIRGIPTQLGNWMSGLFAGETLSVDAEAAIRASGERAGTAIVDGIKSAAASIASVFSGLVIPAPDFSGVIGAIQKIIEIAGRAASAVRGIGGGFAAPGVSTVPSASKPILGQYLPQAGVDGHRATGGPVRGGGLYEVGERGRELFVPPVSGHIVNARDTSAMISGMAASRRAPVARASAPNVTFGNIIVQGGANASADQIAREVGRQTSSALRDHFSDGGT